MVELPVTKESFLRLGRRFSSPGPPDLHVTLLRLAELLEPLLKHQAADLGYQEGAVQPVRGLTVKDRPELYPAGGVATLGQFQPCLCLANESPDDLRRVEVTIAMGGGLG